MTKPATDNPGKTFSLNDAAGLRAAVSRAVQQTAVTDIHTHLYAPEFGELLLYGIDELLTYHYLVAEYFRMTAMSYEEFWALPKRAQANAIWRTLFLQHSPLSEACRGVLTVLHTLGLDVAARDLEAYREYFASAGAAEHVSRTFRAANLTCAVMTNDPFDPAEQPVWEQRLAYDARFHAVLRLDPLLNDWSNTWPRLVDEGYACDAVLSSSARADVRRFLEDWIARMKPLYMAVSLPPGFDYPEPSARGQIIRECILPVAREHNLPFAMMIGVKRAVNPALRLAGDGVARADVGAVERICAEHPHNKFMVTMLSRENQHELCVAARKFRNLLVFGCWWFLNNPSLIDEMTRMRIELLGPSVIPQHSDARVLDQVIYKWAHSREILYRVLSHKYADLIAAGWPLTEAEIKRDAAQLLGGNFWTFLEWQP